MAAKDAKKKKQDPGDWYTGLHAFVFLDHAPEGLRTQEIVVALRGSEPDEATTGRVIFASEFVGAYRAFAHVRVDDSDGQGLKRLQRYIEGPLWDAGARCSFATESGGRHDDRPGRRAPSVVRPGSSGSPGSR